MAVPRDAGSEGIKRLRRRLTDFAAAFTPRTSRAFERTTEAAGALAGVVVRLWERRAAALEAEGRAQPPHDGGLDSALIVDSVPALIIVVTPAGLIEHVNRQLLNYSGATTAEFGKWRTNDFVHPEDRQRVFACFDDSITTGRPYVVEHRLRRSDGEYLWFQARGLPLTDGAGRILRWYVLLSDIEDRRRAEDSLRASEGTLREIINTLPVTAWSTRPDGYCDFLSQRWLDYAGLSAAEAEGWGWKAVIHPDDEAGLVAYWQGCLDSGTPVDTEARMRRADGVYRWFLFRANPLRDHSGNIVKWYGTNIDIEERNRARDELRQSERDARLVVESIPAQVAVLSPTGEVTQVNRRMAEFFGDRVAVLAKWRASDVVPADELPGVVAAMSRSFQNGEPFEMENHLRRADGVYRWFQVRGHPLLDSSGRPVCWYFLLVDIEERKRAEEALRRSEALLAQAQRISATGSFSWCPDTNEVVFSEELYRIFEFDAASAVTLERIGSRLAPDDLPRWSELIRQARGPGGLLAYEMRLSMPDGRLKHLATFGNVVCHQDGRRECIGAMQDVTERRLSEEALERTRSELAHVTRSSSLGTLTASIAHELNQPLAGIVMNAGTCVRMLTAEPPNVLGALEIARRTIRDGRRAADVVARLRALFGKKHAVIEPVDLNDAAREVLSLLAGDLQRNRVVVRTEFGDGTAVSGDRVQLQQVILNLVRNASDAMGGVENRPRQLSLKTERTGDQVRLSVQDAGVGLEATDVSRLFDAFYTTKTDGMGMGLAISRSIVERHRGRLWAAANDGPGATFVVSIPCGADAEVSSPAVLAR